MSTIWIRIYKFQTFTVSTFVYVSYSVEVYLLSLRQFCLFQHNKTYLTCEDVFGLQSKYCIGG